MCLLLKFLFFHISLCRKQKTKEEIEYIQYEGGVEVTAPTQTDMFNKYFASVAPNLHN